MHKAITLKFSLISYKYPIGPMQVSSAETLPSLPTQQILVRKSATAAMQSEKPRAALLASPGMGHLIPVLELGKRLAARHSFRVTVFVVTTDHASNAHSQLLKSAGSDLLDIVPLPPVDIGFMEPAAALGTKIVVQIHESLPVLRSAISRMTPRPSIFTVDIFGTEAMAIANEFNMLKYVLVTSNAWLLAVVLNGPTLDKEVVDDHVNRRKPLKIPGCKPLRYEDTLDVYLLRDPRNNPTYQGFLAAATQISTADGILVNTWEDLEPTTLRALRETKKTSVYPIGPIVRPTRIPILGKSAVTDWLHVQPSASVIYVSFGSGGTLSSSQMMEVAWGLELSQLRFIWVVRPPDENDASSTFFTSGSGSDGSTPDYLPDGFFTRTRGRGLVVPMWAPQDEILGHSSVGGFLSHCGWNSTLESLANEVPLIAWPLYAEQKMNAALLTEELGVAIRSNSLQSDGVIVGREEIQSMVRKIIVGNEGQAMRAKIRELKNSGVQALSEGGSSSNSLSQVAEISKKYMKTKAYAA